MNITKLPSGSYQIREMHKGKRYSVTVPYKPTKREATDLIREKIDTTLDKINSLSYCLNEYIKAKDNVLSESTIRAYKSMSKSIPEWMMKKDISEIDILTMQKFVNEISETYSPKYVRNLYGLVTATIRLFIPNANIYATMPQNVRKKSYTPSYDDVKRLFEYAKGSEYYVALRLAAMSLRRSEILALTLDDLDGDTLTIDKGLVEGPNGYVIKPNPKNDSSNRTIILPHELTEYIVEQGYIYKNTPNGIDNYLHRALPKLGIPFFSLHKLRHFFASYSHELGYSDAVIQSMGGWKTDHVMKSVYRHAMNTEQAKKSMADDFGF